MEATKTTYYFSHDSNARNDDKILMLRSEYSWEGYGIYWLLVEMMFESKETELQHNKLKGIAVTHNIDPEHLDNIVRYCIKEQLFYSDGKVFWSESLRKRKEKFLDLTKKRSKAGKKGMESRWATDNTVITNDNTVITNDNKGNEMKGNEKKRNEKKVKEQSKTHPVSDIHTSIQGLIITKDEHKKLVDAYGKSTVQDVYDSMENHKDLTKKYKSGYLTARTWCRRRQEKEGATNGAKPKRLDDATGFDKW